MRYAGPLLFVAHVLTACSGPADEPTVPGTVPATVPLPDDTGWPPGDLGNFHLAYHVNSDKAEVFAVASASQPGFINFSQCAILGVPCLSGIPSTEDDWKDVDLSQSIDRATIITRFLGFELSFGPYDLTYQEDPDNGFGFYGLPVDIADVEEDQRSIAPTWGGQWKEYEGEDDLFVSRPIEVLNPAPGENIVFTNGEKVVLEWVPTGEGEVTVLVSTRFTLARLFNLEDDGYYELEVDDLGLTANQEDITFTFTRWNVETLRTYGHVVDLLATSDVIFTGQYYNIGNRDPIEPADGCIEAAGMLALPAGAYWGWLGNKTDDLDASQNCLDAVFVNPNPADAQGKDAIVKIELASHDVVKVEYNTYDDSASVYLLTDCEDTSTCVDGSDIDGTDNAPEFVSYFNISEDPQTLYVVLDSEDSVNTIFTLDMDISPVLVPDMFNSCLDAVTHYNDIGQTVVPGDYYGTFFGDWVDDLNPGAGGCTGTSLGGADAMTPIEVGPGQTLQVNINMPDKDPGLYLVSDCSNAFSCVSTGGDLNLDSPLEGLSYINTGANTQTLYLVVDSKNGVGPYFMSLSLTP